MSLRILAGQYKGIPIGHGVGTGVRPTQSRIRKSVFDILGPLRNQVFVDLYAGTGIMGFEAASRWATPVYFIERNRKRMDKIRAMADKFQETEFHFYHGSAFDFLRSKIHADIIFADPPYHLLTFRETESLVKLALENLNPQGSFILETRRDHPEITGAKIRTYGDTQLMFWQNND
jgi:16S rRNA (guanine(966)-N(2))-methyltransferase RsmD